MRWLLIDFFAFELLNLRRADLVELHRPEKAIGDLRADSLVAPLVDGELVAEGEHLEVEGSSFLEASAEGGEEGDEDGLHGKARGYPTLPAPSLPSPPRGAPRNWAFEGGFKGKFDV